jgi:hypothetical protein
MKGFVRAAAAAALAIAGIAVPASRAPADDGEFELHPAYIDGTVELGDDVVLTYGYVNASAYDASTGQNHYASVQLQFPAGGGNTADYHLTVEAGASGLTYNVYAYAYGSGPGYMQFSLPSSQVTVAEGATSDADFLFPDYHLGAVNVTIDVSGAATLVSGSLNFSSYDADTGIYFYGNGSVPSSGEATLLAGPGTLQASAYAYLDLGGQTATYPLGTQTLDLASGGTVDLAYAIHVDPVEAGSISGLVNVDGADLDYFFVQAYGGSPSQSYYVFVADGGSYVVDPANPGTWYLYVYGYDAMADGSYRYYQFPYRYVTVEPGVDLTGVDFDVDAAFVGGTLTTGDWRSPYYSSFGISAYADDGSYAAQYWSFNNTAIPDSLDSELLLSAGPSWQVSSANVYNAYYDADSGSYSNNNVSAPLHDGDVGTLDAGETAALDVSALDFNAGTITLRLTVAGGGTLSNPYVEASGYQAGPGGEYLYSTYAYGSAYTPDPVETGVIKITLAPGTYNLTAYAYVQGSFTSFGRLNGLVVLPGDEIVQDLDAPALAVDSPAPFTEFDQGEAVAVSGTATDPSGVASVTVDGQEVTLGADGSFSATVTDLPEGPNAINVTATDTKGNAVTLLRTVVVLHNADSTAPTVSASPSADCLWSPNHKMTAVTISGKATDASGVKAIAGYAISSNEKDDDKGDGKTAGDCNGKDGYSSPAAFSDTISVGSDGTFSFTVDLRAERSGNDKDRVYIISFEVVDNAGNETPVSVQVCVPHNQ